MSRLPSLGLAAAAALLLVGCQAPQRSELPKVEVLVPPKLAGVAGQLTATAKAVSPSVVLIHNEPKTFKPLKRYLLGLLEGLGGILAPHPWWEWPYRVIAFPFYLLFGYLDFSSTRGSGFFVGKKLVLTNAHVVDNAHRLTCLLGDGRHAQASVVAVDVHRDLALLRLGEVVRGNPALPYPPALKLRRYRTQPGEPVLAIGFPTREVLDDPLIPRSPVDRTRAPNPRVTVGVVSAVGVELGNAYTRYVETDAALNPGNSGGPVVGLDGSVVGIATMIGVGKENEGYAVPATIVLAALDKHLAGEAAQKPPAPKKKHKSKSSKDEEKTGVRAR